MRSTTLITTVALAAALAVPAAASAQPYEYMYSSSPESAPARSQNTQDLRSPDARDAASQAAKPTPQVAQDLRSPDARDVGRVATPVSQPVVEIREVPSNGFDWGDAGIGAAGILAMFSIAAGLTLLLGSRRRRRGIQTAH